jgi:hypothetical protein
MKQAQAASALGIWGQGTLGEHAAAAFQWMAGLPVAARLALVALAILGVAVTLKGLSPEGVPSLLAWGGLHLGLLALLGLPAGYHWYWIPPAFAFLLASSIGLGFLAVWLKSWCLSLALSLWFLGIGIQVVQATPRVEARALAAQEIAKELEKTPADTRVAYYEVGYLGWYSPRPIVDLLGLVSPEVEPELIRQGRLDLALAKIEPTYLVLRADGGDLLHATVPDPVAFLHLWQPVRRMESAGMQFLLFRKRDPQAEVSRTTERLALSLNQGFAVRWLGPEKSLSLAIEVPEGRYLEYPTRNGAQESVFEVWSATQGARLEVGFEEEGQGVGVALESDRWTPIHVQPGGSFVRLLCSGVGSNSCAVSLF